MNCTAGNCLCRVFIMSLLVAFLLCKEVRQAIDWYIPHEVKNLHVYRCVPPFHGDSKGVCFLCKSEYTGAECESQEAKTFLLGLDIQRLKFHLAKKEKKCWHPG